MFSKVDPEAAAESRVEAAPRELPTPAERAARWRVDPLGDAGVMISFPTPSGSATAGCESKLAIVSSLSNWRFACGPPFYGALRSVKMLTISWVACIAKI